MGILSEAARADIARRCAAFVRAQVAWTGEGEPRNAAVAIAITDAEDGSPAFVLTRRVSRLRAHSGQWALPGGRLDPGETAIEAVLRELEEEVGLARAENDVLAVLDDYPTRSGYLITPVVVWGGDAGRLAPNPDEVASVHRVPLALIEARDAVDFMRIPESDRPVVRLRMGERFIHAPTAAVLYQFREVLAGRNTRVDGLEQPVFAWR